ncbi:hypothetical protein ANN_08577 [Periplaneta americana]|uniref:Uncharacterized protein n=1 Tax=Periplaneta americana TaxID=6978 RepID=A0ABQ8T2Z4_PERAM|nr:hypothetical protein ANN_08577 [Periplaneta americana]
MKKVNLRILNETIAARNNFKYLGCTVSSNMSCSQEMKRRLCVNIDLFTILDIRHYIEIVNQVSVSRYRGRSVNLSYHYIAKKKRTKPIFFLDCSHSETELFPVLYRVLVLPIGLPRRLIDFGPRTHLAFIITLPFFRVVIIISVSFTYFDACFDVEPAAGATELGPVCNNLRRSCGPGFDSRRNPDLYIVLDKPVVQLFVLSLKRILKHPMLIFQLDERIPLKTTRYKKYHRTPVVEGGSERFFRFSKGEFRNNAHVVQRSLVRRMELCRQGNGRHLLISLFSLGCMRMWRIRIALNNSWSCPVAYRNGSCITLPLSQFLANPSTQTRHSYNVGVFRLLNPTTVPTTISLMKDFHCQQTRVNVIAGEFRITNEKFEPSLEDNTSGDFKQLAAQITQQDFTPFKHEKERSGSKIVIGMVIAMRSNSTTSENEACKFSDRRNCKSLTASLIQHIRSVFIIGSEMLATSHNMNGNKQWLRCLKSALLDILFSASTLSQHYNHSHVTQFSHGIEKAGGGAIASGGILVRCKLVLVSAPPNGEAANQAGLEFLRGLQHHQGQMWLGNFVIDVQSIGFVELPYLSLNPKFASSNPAVDNEVIRKSVVETASVPEQTPDPALLPGWSSWSSWSACNSSSPSSSLSINTQIRTRSCRLDRGAGAELSNIEPCLLLEQAGGDMEVRDCEANGGLNTNTVTVLSSRVLEEGEVVSNDIGVVDTTVQPTATSSSSSVETIEGNTVTMQSTVLKRTTENLRVVGDNTTLLNTSKNNPAIPVMVFTVIAAIIVNNCQSSSSITVNYRRQSPSSIVLNRNQSSSTIVVNHCQSSSSVTVVIVVNHCHHCMVVNHHRHQLVTVANHNCHRQSSIAIKPLSPPLSLLSSPSPL